VRIDLSTQRYAFFALLAAALFGASTPLAKHLLGSTEPALLAGLLYLGSGLGLLILWLGAGKGRFGALPAARDWTWLLGAVAAGGVAAPLLLLYGLRATPAGSASLLLNLESVMTAALAGWVFGEAVGLRVWCGAAIMLLAACMLAYDPAAALGISGSAALIVGACLMWAIDNNLTRRVSASDAVFLALFKGLAAGSCNVALALWLGASLPAAPALTSTLAVGFLGYGVSLVLFILALRHLGSARAGAHFATAPFFGSAIAILVLGEPLTWQFAGAVALMGTATWLVLSESHAHQHVHERLEHEHPHVHDEHHQHSHRGDEGVAPHTHAHVHEPMSHVHPHLPDLHHRHRH
jgi:drug/metabolite transporter (DMT)-like permease